MWIIISWGYNFLQEQGYIVGPLFGVIAFPPHNWHARPLAQGLFWNMLIKILILFQKKSSGVHFFTNIIETDDGALLEARWRQPQSMDRIYGLEVMRLVQSTGIKGALISA